MRTRRRRATVASMVVLIVAGLAPVLTGGAAGAVAGVTISQPADGEIVGPALVMWGTAASPLGVADAEVAVLRLADNLWLQADGRFAVASTYLPAALAGPGQLATTWSFTALLGRGHYLAVARARDGDGGVGDEAVTSFRVTTPPMVTLQFGRAMVGQTRSCQLVDGAVTLFDVAEALRVRGLFAVGVVVPDRVEETDRRCFNGNQYASWRDLALLRDVYGWSFVSNGQSRLDLPRLGRDDQIVESCGSLDAFAARGHTRAWGLFGPNSNQVTDAIALDVLNRCFAFTRTYSSGITEEARLVPPYYERVAVAGGGRGTYDPPAEFLAKATRVGEGGWLSIGSYKLVQGQRPPGDGTSWDCTSLDAKQHWTSDDEIYCWQDYLAILDGLPAGIEAVDPATVAERWGRVPSVELDELTVRPTTVTPADPSITVAFRAYESGTWWVTANGSGCNGSGLTVASGSYRSWSSAVVDVPRASLPAGQVALELCLQNGFGRVGSRTAFVVVT